MIGEQISHFFIIRQLGSGGMGDVYEAQDTRLPRSVAIKFLKPTLLNDGDALKRFKREARLASSLNHPNICTILDVEEANGQAFIAMELLEGQSLKARLSSAEPLALTEIIDIAKQVADALAAAHDQGIVHRDIAPGNVFITTSGLVKLLDFGLAKHAPNPSEDGQTTDELTAGGVVAGTVHYMSPERFTEAAVDYRSDLFSLGILLYQMATGARPFDVAPRNALISAIESEPHVPVRERAPHLPAELGRIIDKLLAKRPEDRYQSARTLRIDLDEIGVGPMVRPHAVPARRRRPAAVAVGLAAAIALVSAAWIAFGPSATPGETTLTRFANIIDGSPAGGVTFTPDGRALLYTGSAESRERIMMLRLDESTPHVITNVDHGEMPFVSPDGRQLAFRAREDTIAAVTLNEVDAPRRPKWRSWFARKGWRYGNGAWIGDKVIIGEAATRGLLRRDPSGRVLVPLTQLDSTQGEVRHAAPLILPGEKAVVFTVSKHGGFPGMLTGPLAIAPLDLGRSTPAPHVLLGIEARRAIAFVDDRLLYTSADGRAIMAVPLDVKHQRTSGQPVAVLLDSSGNLETGALADNGSLLYLRRPRTNAIVLVDANGGVHAGGIANPEGPFMYPRLSPDGKRVAVQVSSALGEDIWLYDIASGTPTRLTTTGRALHPTWTPDGRRIVFMVAGTRGLISQSVENSVAAEPLPGTQGAFAPSVAPDGKSVLFQQRAEGRWTIWSTSFAGDTTRHKVMNDPFGNLMPALSPDGHWLAYVSTTPRGQQVYVRPFPAIGPAVQVSDSSGGNEPTWSADGRRVYYRNNGLLMAASVTTPTFAVTSRQEQFRGEFDATMPHRNYDVSSDGKLFLMISQSSAGNPEAVVILNWLSKLRGQLALAR